MKKLKIITAIIIICTSSLFASRTNIIDFKKEDIKEQVSELFETSKQIVEKGMVLNMLFSFDSDGDLVVYKVTDKKKYLRSDELEDTNHRKTIKINK